MPDASQPPTDHFADRLIAACDAKGGPICVGLDPVLDRLPKSILAAHAIDPAAGPAGDPAKAAAAILSFCKQVINAVAPHVPCVKIQSACFERYLAQGVRAYRQVVAYARGRGLLVIGDAKRGDIGVSSDHYAAGCLADQHSPGGPSPGPDALTVNAYLGADGLAPFIGVARDAGKGLFALVRTSNPGGDAIQSLQLADGRTVAQAVGQVVAEAGEDARLIGKTDYSLLGAVVGATKAAEIAELRRTMPRQIFLVPGFGAQGGQAEDVRACFHRTPDGPRGAIVTASRSITYAYEKSAGQDWAAAVQQAAVTMKDQINQAVA